MRWGVTRRKEIIPDPTYGYLVGSLLEHEKTDESLRNYLIARDLGFWATWEG